MLKSADIKGFPLFAGLNETELESIARLASRKEFPANSIIYTPDSCTTDVYLLEDTNDSVQMEIPGKDGGPGIVVHTLAKGELFSWSPLCPPHTRTTTARTVQPATVVIVEGNALNKLLAANEHMGYIIMKNLSGILSTRLSYVTLVFARDILKLREKQLVR